jgi:hypothetical protein
MNEQNTPQPRTTRMQRTPSDPGPHHHADQDAERARTHNRDR